MMASVVAVLIVLELGCRLMRGPSWLAHWPNLVLQERIDTKHQGGRPPGARTGSSASWRERASAPRA